KGGSGRAGLQIEGGAAGQVAADHRPPLYVGTAAEIAEHDRIELAEYVGDREWARVGRHRRQGSGPKDGAAKGDESPGKSSGPFQCAAAHPALLRFEGAIIALLLGSLYGRDAQFVQHCLEKERSHVTSGCDMIRFS